MTDPYACRFYLLLPQKVYNAIPTSLKAPLISHAHGQKALFPNLDANSALKDVQSEFIRVDNGIRNSDMSN